MLPYYGNNVITQDVSASAPGYVFVVPQQTTASAHMNMPTPKANMRTHRGDIFEKTDHNKTLKAVGIVAAALALALGIKKLGSKIINKIKKPPKTP